MSNAYGAMPPPGYLGMGGAPLSPLGINPFAVGYTNTPGQVNNMSTNIANGQSPAGPNISPTTNAQFSRVGPPNAQPPQGTIPQGPIGGAQPFGNPMATSPYQQGYNSFMKSVNGQNGQQQGTMPGASGQPGTAPGTAGTQPGLIPNLMRMFGGGASTIGQPGQMGSPNPMQNAPGMSGTVQPPQIAGQSPGATGTSLSATVQPSLGGQQPQAQGFTPPPGGTGPGFLGPLFSGWGNNTNGYGQ
jgi:hypothetical protein